MNNQRVTGTLAVACLVVVNLFATPTALAQNPAVTIAVNASLNRHAINPLVYGTAFATAAQLADLNAPANRWGGNSTTRYNWRQNADNRAQDWYFESIPYASAVEGEGGDTFVSTAKSSGAEAMLTVPTIGWVAKVGSGRTKLASFSIAKYGAQTGNDWQWYADAGNGVLSSTGQNVTGNNPADASVLVDSTFQQQWIQHLVSRWGAANAGGVKYYLLDNEPSLWFSTHRDVHPTGPTMDEIRDKSIDYAGKIKDADPNAIVCGPEEWGWSGYLYSGYDQQYGAAHGWCCFPDRDAHGGMDYLPWYLDQMRQNNASTGRRLLDVFTVHFYPQGGEFSNDTSTAMQQRRNRSTRALWDPNYVDETWINDKVKLIPRIKGWVSQYYPGTKTGITEYNWGAEGHINGATTQADILGIFGREGVDVATRWTTPDASTPTYKAMKMYRNYDNAKSTFGDTSVSASVPNPDSLSAFAAQRTSDGALTVMVVNKTLSGSTPVTITLAGFTPGTSASAWQLTSANAITRIADVAVAAGAFTASVPAQSVTLYVIPAGSGGGAAFTASVNFQPAGSPVPSGYLVDSGAAYGARGGGRTYGWNAATSETRDRNATNSPDQRYDTFVQMQRPSNPTLRWEIAVPNGTYSVRVVVGDPSYVDSVYRVAVEDVVTVAGTPTNVTHWFDGTQTVTVSDGRLTITSASGATNNKICFVEIAGR